MTRPPSLLHLTTPHANSRIACPLPPSPPAKPWQVHPLQLPLDDDGIHLSLAPLQSQKPAGFQGCWLPFVLPCLTSAQLIPFIRTLGTLLTADGLFMATVYDSLLAAQHLAYGFSGSIPHTQPPRSSDALLSGDHAEVRCHLPPEQWGRALKQAGWSRIRVERKQGQLTLRAQWQPRQPRPQDDKIQLIDGYEHGFYALPGTHDRLSTSPQPWLLNGEKVNS